MNENIVKRNNLLAQKVIKGLESRNMSGYYAESKEEALKIALGLIPEGSSISMGGAMSVHEIGLSDALKNDKYNFWIYGVKIFRHMSCDTLRNTKKRTYRVVKRFKIPSFRFTFVIDRA